MYEEILATLKSIGLLIKGKEVIHYYLPLLNLYWEEEEGEEEFFKDFRKYAISVKDSTKFIGNLIKDINWRPTLMGNAIVILLRAKEFQKDMIWRLEKGSWVSPQLAVGIALIDDGFAETELIRIIGNASEESNPKTIMSAYSSLKFIESEFANHFEKTELFLILKEKDAWDNSTEIAKQHFEFWKNIEPIK